MAAVQWLLVMLCQTITNLLNNNKLVWAHDGGGKTQLRNTFQNLALKRLFLTPWIKWVQIHN